MQKSVALLIECAKLLLIFSILGPSLLCARSAGQEWRSYGGDAGGTKFSPLTQINRANVAQLKRAWTYHTGELGDGKNSYPGQSITAFECTPLVIDGVLYLSTPSSRVIALNSETGRELWRYDPQAGRGGKRFSQVHRGVAYWQGAARDGKGIDRRILFGTGDGELIALDASSGKPCAGFGQGGSVDLRQGLAQRWPSSVYAVTSPPAIYKDLVIVGSRVPEGTPHGPPGDVRAFDVRTGKLVWRFRTVPRPGEIGHETWEGESWKGRTGVNVWSVMSVDEERGLIFMPIGSAAYDFYGGDRKGHNLFANSLVALDAATGKLIWYYQLVHHDLWDYDPPAQPSLITVRHGGREIPAVAQVTKTGSVFVFDRLTGKPLFPVEERPVPRSTVPGEATSATQPFPLLPPPLSRQTPMTRQEISRVTPESNKYCTELFDQVVSGGLFTPLGIELTLWFPGTLGGATWSGGSFDPTTGYFFVNANEIGAIGAMKRQAGNEIVPYKRASKLGEYARFWDENRLPCQQPPWGTLNAIDLNTGKIVWRVPLGIVDELVAKGIRDTGAPNIGGSIATAGGLVFIAGTNDSRFRAFDAQTGKELWVDKLEAGGHATPITYQGRRGGKQFVIIAAGGGGFFSKSGADSVAAYALP